MLNAMFAAFEAFFKFVVVIVVIIIIVILVLTTQKSKQKGLCGKMYCQNCGEQIPPQAQFCPRCGFLINKMGNAQQFQQKSKIAAGLFGIFLGALGIHNFYLGFKGKAIAQLLISLMSFGLLAWVSAVWGLVEGIMILAGSISYDASGIPLKD